MDSDLINLPNYYLLAVIALTILQLTDYLYADVSIFYLAIIAMGVVFAVQELDEIRKEVSD